VFTGEPNPKEVDSDTWTDVIRQAAAPQVDVLFVVDDSCSMEDDQDQLRENFPAFLDYFVGTDLDYHIGVVTTDMQSPVRSGQLVNSMGRKWLDDTADDPEAMFFDLTNVGTAGSAEEMGMGATYTALQSLKHGYNRGFRRDDAALHVVVVSDEYDATDPDIMTSGDFEMWFIGQVERPQDRSFSSLTVERTSRTDVTTSGSVIYDTQAGGWLPYDELTEALGGISASLLDDDWSAVLDEVGLLVSGLRREYPLSRIPVPGTIQVRVSTDTVVLEFFEGEDWTYDPVRNSVAFAGDHIPNALETVELTYEVLGGV